jgi:hypothetical protein
MRPSRLVALTVMAGLVAVPAWAGPGQGRRASSPRQAAPRRSAEVDFFALNPGTAAYTRSRGGGRPQAAPNPARRKPSAAGAAAKPRKPAAAKPATPPARPAAPKRPTAATATPPPGLTKPARR